MNKHELDKADAQRLIAHYKRHPLLDDDDRALDLGLDKWAVARCLDDYVFSAKNIVPAAIPRTKFQQVVDYIRDNPAATQKEVRRNVGCSQSLASNVFKRKRKKEHDSE